jgi:thymidylate synthase (FAD)
MEVPMKVTLTECTTNPVLSIERAASNCYDSEPSNNGKIMTSCYKSGHHSVLEFADFTFHIEGVSRALLAQITRHRVASFAVRSQRYCSEDGFESVVPRTIRENNAACVEYKKALNRIQECYEYLQELGIPNEDARMILPNACETIFEVKMNGRELIHFCNERLCSRAQWEIRELAREMKRCVANYNDACKKFSKFLVPKCYANEKYPFCTEHNSCGMAPKLSDVYSAYLTSKGMMHTYD